MHNSWLIALRELKERIRSRSFLLMAFLGPFIILLLTYLLFSFGGNKVKHWNVLIVDHGGLFENKIMPGKDKAVSYSFYNGILELEEFTNREEFQKFDAFVEINEKIFKNKVGFVFYRNTPDPKMQTRVKFQIERRLEELLIEKNGKIPLKEYLKIKQPLVLTFADVYDPNNLAGNTRAWVGFFFGTLIFLFIALFGMTILRSVSSEKSNRIVEVLLATVSPKSLMLGKIIGIGIAAFIQFFIWSILIGFGLYLMRELVFIDLFAPENLNATLLSEGTSYTEQYFTNKTYNEFVDLIFNRIHYGTVLFFFILFFIFGYLFYGALFAAIGAVSGSENDGQQFVLPIIFLLLISLYSGYHFIHYPESTWAKMSHYIPFTSPIVVMVKLSMGYSEGETYSIYFSLILLILSAFVMLSIAARLYKNGILQFGHRIRMKLLLKWLKKT